MQISLDDLQIGAILAADVKDRSGRLLLGTGAEIEERHLKIFRGWGVADICIESESADGGVDNNAINEDPEFRAMVAMEVKKDFEEDDLNYPFIQALLEICVDRAIVQQAGGAK